MTVFELIQELMKVPGNTPVKISVENFRDIALERFALEYETPEDLGESVGCFRVYYTKGNCIPIYMLGCSGMINGMVPIVAEGEQPPHPANKAHGCFLKLSDFESVQAATVSKDGSLLTLKRRIS